MGQNNNINEKNIENGGVNNPSEILWYDALWKLIKWHEIIIEYISSAKTLCEIGGEGFFAILIRLLYPIERIVIINKEPMEEIFKLKAKIEPLLKGIGPLSNKKDFNFEIIESDARYTQELKNKLNLKQNEKFDIMIISRTLHHLRSGYCIVHQYFNKDKIEYIAEDRTCIMEPEACIHDFEPEKIIDLFSFSKITLIYENIEPTLKDTDKEDTGGNLRIEEFVKFCSYLEKKNYKITFISPELEDNNYREILPNTWVTFLVKKNER